MSVDARRRIGDFIRLYHQDLAPVVRELDAWRQRRFARVIVAWAVIVVAGVFAIALIPDWIVGLSFAILILCGVAYAFASAGYREDFKRRLVAPLVARFDASLSFAHDEGIAREAFEASRLFRELSVTNYASDDLVSGRIGETEIRFAEVDATNVRTRGSGKNRRTETTRIFKGLFLVADFNKHFRGETYVLPDVAQKLLGRFGQSLQGMSSLYGELVKLEDAAFEREFVVYSTDQVEARYILSGALMARILAFRAKQRCAMRFAFVASTLYVAIPLGRDLFEPRFFSSIDDPALYEAFWDDLVFATGIVDDLALDTRIWTKA